MIIDHILLQVPRICSKSRKLRELSFSAGLKNQQHQVWALKIYYRTPFNNMQLEMVVRITNHTPDVHSFLSLILALDKKGLQCSQ